jgi:hypothetical protein
MILQSDLESRNILWNEESERVVINRNQVVGGVEPRTILGVVLWNRKRQGSCEVGTKKQGDVGFARERRRATTESC